MTRFRSLFRYLIVIQHFRELQNNKITTKIKLECHNKLMFLGSKRTSLDLHLTHEGSAVVYKLEIHDLIYQEYQGTSRSLQNCCRLVGFLYKCSSLLILTKLPFKLHSDIYLKQRSTNAMVVNNKVLKSRP